MSYLNHEEIQELMKKGVISFSGEDYINTASLDIRLGDEIIVEEPIRFWDKVKTWFNRIVYLLFTNKRNGCTELIGKDEIVYRHRQAFRHKKISISPDGYKFKPGSFILGYSLEHLNFPDDIAALLRTKSSMGRSGFEHMDAGWVDPGFNGRLTLEYQNNLRYHSIRIYPGDRVGQLIFFRGKKVLSNHSYRKVGNYNGSKTVKMASYTVPTRTS